MPGLFDALEIGALRLRNRVIMAPMTRGRATRDHLPTSLMATYYRQRASAGLIVSEGIGISREGLGWPYAPGRWSKPQVEAWKPVTAAVHEEGGLIIAQLWHMGRLVHPSYLGGAAPVAPSPIRAPGHAHTYGSGENAGSSDVLEDGSQPYAVPRALEAAEIPRLVEDYCRAATNAISAGFDGVQIHAANGYLLDQFLRDASNFRTDAYGGSIEGRVRLLREVTRAVVEAVGAGRVGVRLSPNGEVQGVDDHRPHLLFAAAATCLDQCKAAFVELREPRFDTNYGRATVRPVHPTIRRAFGGVLLLNTEYTRTLADDALMRNEADAISFGRPFIANADLVARFCAGLDLQPAQQNAFYRRGADGYI